MFEKRKQAKEERNRLEKINDVFSWRYSTSVKEHFNKAGKLDAFAKAGTPEETAAQKQSLRGLFSMSDEQSTLAYLKATDIFTQVARRVGNDNELASLLPAGKLDAKDVEVLEKHQLTSLAALAKVRVQS